MYKQLFKILVIMIFSITLLQGQDRPISQSRDGNDDIICSNSEYEFLINNVFYEEGKYKKHISVRKISRH